MTILDAIKEAEINAEEAKEKYQKVTYQELLRYYLAKGEQEINAETQSIRNTKSTKNGSPKLPKAKLVANKGNLKHQVVWAVLKLNERNEVGTVKNVRNVIDLDLSLKKPTRPYTSKTLAELVPDYLGRKVPEEGKGYIYVPNEDSFEIFNELIGEED